MSAVLLPALCAPIYLLSPSVPPSARVLVSAMGHPYYSPLGAIMRYLAFVALALVAQVYGDMHACLYELAEVVRNIATIIPSTKYEAMAAYSGKGINDLGKYFSCCNLKGAEYTLFSANFGGYSAYFSLCGPQNCTVEDYWFIIGNFTQQGNSLEGSEIDFFAQNVLALASLPAARPARRQLQSASLPIQITFPQRYIHDHFTNLSAGAIVMLVICCLIILLVLTGTAIDLRKLHRPTPKAASSDYQLLEMQPSNPQLAVNAAEASMDAPQPEQDSFTVSFLLCFSLYTNVPKLFASRSAEKVGQKQDSLEILSAVRVMSMGWVVLGHTYAFRFFVGAVKNPLQIGTNFKDSKTAIIYGALFSVDSFFWISGFLMAFLLLQQLNTKKSIKGFAWAHLYFHRFYRILPAYMFILFLTWAFTKYAGNGPLWSGGDAINDQCHDYWWTNLIFLNNFIPHGDGSGCLGQSWYLANDMQFFAISPPIFYLYHRHHRLFGWALVAALCLCAVICGTALADADHYNAVFIAADNSENNFMGHYYMKPYCRVAPYAVGIACGMVLYSYRLYKKTGEVYDKYALWLGRVMDRRQVRYAAYVAGMFLINFFIFIQYDAYKDVDHGWQRWNQAENDLFIGFSRFFWAVGMSLVLMPMLLGYNAVATWFLSLGVWTPLARLTFCTYLIHLHLIFIVYLSQNEAYWFNDLNITASLTFITAISYAAAVPLTLCVESPFMAFEKLLKTRSRKGSKSAQ